MDTTKRVNGGPSLGVEEKIPQDGISHSTGVDTHSNSNRLSAEDIRAEKRASVIATNHEWDPNMPTEKRESIESAVRHHDLDAERAIIEAIEDDSPYPEVRAAVRNYDEDVPASTIRAWVLGLILATIGSGVNMLFSMRSPPISITSTVAQLVAYPLGLAWAKWMPDWKFKTFGYEWSLNPGPFNMKEHTIVVVMSNASYAGGAVYSTDTLLAQIVYYKQDFGWGFALLYTISMQCMGYGLAGLCRRFLVWPASMIWPTNLINTTLMYTLHKNEKPDPAQTNGWRITRFKWFMVLGIAGFIWYWFPGFIFTALSTFTFVTWIKPQDVVVNQIFGANSGLGIIPITFDWTQISGFIGSPLIPPFHAIANTMIGLFSFFLILTPILHYTNTWYAQYLPLVSQGTFDNTGAGYNTTRVITPEKTFDMNKYKAYSPLYLPTTFAVSYGLSFSGFDSFAIVLVIYSRIAATIVHTALFHGKEIWYRFKVAREQEEDVHMRLMKKYKDIPDWQYGALFVCMFALGLGTVLGYDTHLAWWAYIISLLFAGVWLVPAGIIQAITNIQIGLNVFTEFVIGYMQPGKPLAMMLFKSYGYICMSQALYFVQDLKLGHYMKVPPRSLFWSQVVASIWTSIVQIAVMYWALGNIKGVCTPAEAEGNHFVCPNARVYFSASIIWGLLGPKRIFSPGALYSPLLWFFLIGAISPVIVWVLAKKFPRSPIRYLNMPVIFSGTGMIPPSTAYNYFSWGIVGFIFNKWIKDRYRGWWSHYNYATSAALDIGLAIGTLVIFFALTMPGKTLHWWGNDVVAKTVDAAGAVRATVPDGSTFGPSTWQ